MAYPKTRLENMTPPTVSGQLQRTQWSHLWGSLAGTDIPQYYLRRDKKHKIDEEGLAVQSPILLAFIRHVLGFFCEDPGPSTSLKTPRG